MKRILHLSVLFLMISGSIWAQPIALVSTSSTNITCKGSDDGTISATVSGGTTPYTYLLLDYYTLATVKSFSSGLTSHTFTDVVPGDYYIRVIDSSLPLPGSVFSSPISITEPAIALSGTIDVQTNLLCYGASTGSVTVSGHDGWGSYTYNIDGGAFQGSGVFGLLSGGSHTVIVKDAGGCEVTVPIDITFPTQIIGTISGLTNVTCNGLSNGKFTVTASGGAGNYQIRLDAGSWFAGPSHLYENLPANNYTITILDQNSCSITVPITISEPDVLDASFEVVKNLTCFGGNDAEIRVLPTGGTPSYSFIWERGGTDTDPDGETSQNIGLVNDGGYYTVTIDDANNCGGVGVLEVSFFYIDGFGIVGVDIPDQIQIIPDPAAHIDACQGQTNGSITVVASGGTGALTYSQTENGTYQGSNVFAGLGLGNYEVWVQDANLCKVQGASVAIAEKPLPVVSITISETSGLFNNDGIICNGASVTLTASGGTSYAWSTGATGPILTVSPSANTTYTVTVTNANGCTQTASQAITVNPLPTPSITISETSGLVNNDGIICDGASVTLTASGGTTYAWSNGASGASISVSPAANTTYTVTATSNGCTQTASQAITVNPLPTASITISETSGIANNDGIICSGASVTLTASGGTSYAWSTGATGPILTVSPSANTTYTVTVTNANGCTQTASQAITVNPLPSASVSISETSGIANNDGIICNGASVTLTASGGTSYAWSTGATGPILTVSPSANTTYTVTVTNANGCTQTASQSITVNPLPLASISISETSGITNNDGIICDGASVTLTALGGTTYAWSNGASGPSISVSPAINTTYTVTATSNGCTQTASQAITVNPLPTASITISETSGIANNDGIICSGASVTLTASGGTSYAWSTGATGPVLTVSPAVNTTYTVTVTNANGCTQTAIQAITVNPLPTASITISETSGIANNDGIICDGASVTLTASGGTSYAWSTGATGPILTVNPSANTTYTVTVTSNGCTQTASQAITVNPLPTPSITISETSGLVNNDGIICNGASVTLTASGGTTYAWSNGASGASISVSPAASTTYTVTATSNGCTQTASQTITVNPLPTASITISETSGVANNDGIICNGASVTLTASGGTSYAWSTGASGPSISVNPAVNTTYTVTVTNANGCTQTASQAITVNPLPTPSITISETSGLANNDGIICDGASVTLTASGGTTYAWSNGASGSSISVSPAANTTYTVTATLNGCTQTASQAIVVNPLPTASISISETSGIANNDGIICSGASVTLTASGGTSYAWSTGATGPILTVSPSANTTYAVTVTNANGCTQTASQAITVNPLPSASISISETSGIANNDGIICDGASVTLTASGGTSYAWSTGATGPILTVSPSANTTYTVTVTNANGCMQTASQAITVNPLPTPSITISETSGLVNNDGIICDGASVTLTASGGTTYAWSNGASGASISVNPAASITYTVTATSNGCMQTASQAITVNTLPTASIVISENSGVANDDGIICEGASVTLTASGGTSYAWSTGASGPSISVNPAVNTIYTVTVTNANGCTQTASQAITVNPLPSASISISETSGIANNDGIICDGASVTLTALGGTSYAWSTGASGPSISVNPAANTTYTVTVTNANGCTQTASQVITVNPLPTASITIAETSGLADNDGIICDGDNVTLTAIGGTSYLWSTGDNSISINVTPSVNTTFSVTVTDGNGCLASSSQLITVNSLPAGNISIAESSGIANNDGYICEGASVTLTATGGSSYTWSTGDNTPSITVNPVTNSSYEVTVTNINGCSVQVSQNITVNALPVAAIGIFETSGLSNNDGIICEGSPVMLTASGGTSYNWSTGDTNPTINLSPLLTSTYTVTVTNADGCIDTESITVTVNSNPNPTLSGPTPVCQGTDGNIYTTDGGMTNYIWNVPAGGVITSGGNITDNSVTIRWDTDGLHTIMVNYSNTNLCSAISPSTFDITVNAVPTANTGPDATICYDATYKIPSASVTNEVSYLWKTLGTGKFENGLGTINNVISPVYTPGDADKTAGFVKLMLEVTGAASCNIVRDTITLTIPAKLLAAIGAPKPFDIDATTRIQVHIKTGGHINIGDLGYYLVAPDGNTAITLKAPAAQPCNLGYDADVIFDSQSTNPLNVCTLPARPLGQYTVNGTFMAEGAWNTLFNNFNPAEGGWAVQVRDVATVLPLGTWPQGNLVQAEITFTSSDGKVVSFNSGSISIPIKNGNIALPGRTSYIVPLGLRTSCSNSCDATAVVNVIGGVAPFTYAWNDPASSTNDTLDLCKGTFSVTVTDAIGCTSVATVDVSSPPAILLSSVSYSNNDTLKCYGETTDITINASGGTGVLKYTYAGAPAPNDTINTGTAFAGLGAGTYNFRILDINGCFKDTTIQIVAPDTLKATLRAVTHNLCYGTSTGSAVVKAEGGTKKFVFTLKQAGIPLNTIYTMEDTAQFTGLAAGTYTIAVRDTNSCSITPELTVIITQPAVPLSIDLVTVGKETSCASNDDGWAKFNVSGGATPLTYSVFNLTDTVKALQDSITGIPRGTYTAAVTDINGCKATYGSPIDILSDPAIVFNKPFAITPVTKCFYNNDGTVTVSATHDNGDPDNIEVAIDDQAGTYYALTAPGYSNQFTGLSGGWHRIYAKDAGNPGSCIFVDSAFIASPDTIKVNTSITFVSTNNFNVDIIASGGTGTLEYALLDSNRDSIQGFGSNFSFTGLTNGRYYALVRDGERCSVERPFDLADFTVSVTHLKCYGDNSGRIQINAGVTGLYLFDLNNGAVQNDSGIFVNLAAGKYYLRVYNQMSTLVFYDSTILTQPASPIQIISLAFPATLNNCSYDENVSVRMMIKATGGIAPYQYSKDGITYGSDPDIIMFGKGTHIIFVRDDNACVVQSLPITVTAPDPVVMSIENIVPVKGASKGSVKLKASGPGKPIQFSIDDSNWFGTTDSTYTFTGLDAGTYKFYARNAVGCRDTIDVTIPVAQTLNVKILIDTTQMVCTGDKKAILSLIITDASVTSARFYISGTDTTGWLNQKTIPYTDLGAGIYSIYVEDGDGRVFVKDTIIPGPVYPFISTTVTDDNCNGSSNIGDIGAIVLNMPSDYNNYTYLWSNDSTTKDLINVNAGDYSVTITYGKNNACSLEINSTIGATNILDVTINPVGLVCPGKPFNLQARASEPNCTYEWVPSIGLSNPNISNPEATIWQSAQYLVFASDPVTNCKSNASVLIDVEDLPDIYPNPDTVFIVPDGHQILMTNLGYITYSWTPTTYLDNPDISWPTVTPLDNITYYVTGISPAGCVVTDTVEIRVTALVIPSGFTPNGDGVNDKWIIDNIEDFLFVYIEIYNRWGQKIFSSPDGYTYDKAFDGTRNGKDLPIGTYYYVIYLDDKTPLTGTVTIVR